MQQFKNSQSNQTNQLQTQIMIECGNPLSRATQGPRQVQERRPVLRRSKHVLFMKKPLNMIERGQPVVGRDTNHEPGAHQTRSSDDSKSFNVEDKTAHDRTDNPLSAVTEITSQEIPKHVPLMKAQTSTLETKQIMKERGNPLSAVTQVTSQVLNEVDIDFRIPGLPHSVVKQTESSHIRELVKKIQNHPDRHALQLDLQQNKAYNPFSATTKQMITDVGNAELFELFETNPETQCKACQSYWSEGIVCCTCGHLLKESAANRGVIQYTLDLLSIAEYVIKKGRPHGHRHGKAPEKKEYHLVHNLKKRCLKKHFKAIHDRFLRDHVFRERMLEHDRDEDVCRKWDDLAERDFTYRMSESEYFHYRQNWLISLNKSGNTTEPLRNRSDFNQALSTLNRLHREAGGQPLRPMPCWKYQQWKSSSSSSSTWWQWSGSWWSS